MKNNRAKNKASIMILAAVLATGVFSCKTELLEPIPKTAISDRVAFDTPDRIALQINNLYASAKNGNYLGGRVHVYGDIRGGDFLNRTTNGVTGLLVWNHSLNEQSQNDVINLWTFIYQAINQCNVFIDGMEANEGKFVPPAFPENFKTVTAPQYVAEARFIRAISYHYLLQFYARPFVDGAGSKPGVPLRLKGEKDSNNNELARASVAEVYAQILDDLTFAENNLPADYSSALLRTTRAHKNTAIAFKTRVNLTKGDYAAVIAEASKIVPDAAPFTAKANAANTLAASVNDVFVGAQTNAEMLLSMPFTAQNAPGTQNGLGFYFRASGSAAFPATNPGGGEYSFNTSGGIYTEPAWVATDARRTAWIYKNNTEFFLGKYPGASPFLDRAPVIRWAEVVLNYAEALARTGGSDAKATAMVNAVRVRSAGAGNALAPATNADLINGILMERRIEFVGEGIRNMDIQRLMIPYEGKASVATISPSQGIWTWPIPLTERLANTACEPNP